MEALYLTCRSLCKSLSEGSDIYTCIEAREHREVRGDFVDKLWAVLMLRTTVDPPKAYTSVMPAFLQHLAEDITEGPGHLHCIFIEIFF